MKPSRRPKAEGDPQILFLTYGAALQAYHVERTDRRWLAVREAWEAFHAAFLPGQPVPQLVRPEAAS